MQVHEESQARAPAQPPPRPGFATLPDPSLWENCPEVDLEVTDIEGNLPADLRGELLRNGPGKRDLGRYFWDGDGMVRALSISESGRVRYRSRYIETPKYLAERHANKPVFRSAGTQRPGGMLNNMFRMPATEANTHLLAHAGKLWALHEGGHPFALDPGTLATLGTEHFGGALSRRVTFSAHPHPDPETGEVLNFGLEGGLKGARIHAYRLSKEGRLTTIGVIPISRMTFMHDFALSQRWLCFFVPPVSLSMPRMILGMGSVLDAFTWQPGIASEVILLSRDGTRLLRFEVEPFVLGHVIGAREQGDEVIIDFVRAPNWDRIGNGLASFRTDGMSLIEDMCQWRMRFDTRTKQVQSERLGPLPADFPRSNERLPIHAQRYSYLAANTQPRTKGMFTATMKLDTKTGDSQLYDFGPGFIAQEPIFVPAEHETAEDRGYLLQFLHDNARKATSCVVLDARKLEDGPICTIRLPVSAGMTFHGTFVPSAR
jgi:all-trans-8'-apo-beta-carotenal 15,15'-oxygenase